MESAAVFFPPVPSTYDTPQDRADAAAFLTAARAIIASPDAWAPRCQWALDPDGAAVDAHDPLAVRWSASAAMRVAARRAGGNAVWLGWTALDASVGASFTAFEWAADTTPEVMLRVFDLAISRLGAPAPAKSRETDAPDVAVPPANLTASLLDAAFDEVERVAAERGIDRDAFVTELLSRVVEGLWDDEDREGLRAKAHAAVSAYVDALFDGLNDARVAA